MIVNAKQAVLAAVVAGPAGAYIARDLGPLFAIPLGVAAAYLTLRLLRPDLLERAIEAGNIYGSIAPLLPAGGQKGV